MKKIIALLLCFTMVFGSLAAMTYALEEPGEQLIDETVGEDNESEGTEVIPGGEGTEVIPGGEGEGTGESIDDDGDDDIPQPEAWNYDEGTVAVLYLCSNWTGLPSLGHIWIYIQNVSGGTLKVGAYQLPAGEGVSVGSFALTRSDGAGIYYNIEAYTGNVIGMNDSLYIKKEINSSQLNKISNRILRSNFWDPIIFNCIFFAAMSWDVAGGSFVFPVSVFPALARLQLRMHGAKAGLTMYNPGRDRVFKQRGSGSAARLELCSDGSCDTAPG